MEAQQAQTFCFYCVQDIVEGEPLSTLECHHKLHTACLIAGLRPRPNGLRFCGICEYQIEPDVGIPFQDDEEDEYDDDDDDDEDDESENEETRPNEAIRKMWDENPAFRTRVKEYVQQVRLVKRQKKILEHHIQEKKNEVRTLYDGLHSQLLSLVKITKKTVLSSPHYKSYRNKNLRLNLLRGRIIKDNPYNIKEIQNALRAVPGLRRWPVEDWRFRRNPIRRAFYLRCSSF